MKTVHYYSILVLASLAVFGCSKIPKYDATPAISFASVEVFRDIQEILTPTNLLDSVVVGINFQDGDGDLGIATSDIPDSEPNYVLVSELLDNGIYIEDVNTKENGRFPQLAPTNVKSPIDGVLYYSINLLHSSYNSNDTLRFTIYIQDRSGNKSNTIVTDPFVVKKL